MKWEDATRYSQRDPYQRVPRSWHLRLTPDVLITVVSDHIHYNGQWIVHCAPWFHTKPVALEVTDNNATEAQRIALNMVRAKINELASAIATHNE